MVITGGLKTRYFSRLDSSSRNRNGNNCWKFDKLFHFQKESLTEILASPGKNVKFIMYKCFQGVSKEISGMKWGNGDSAIIGESKNISGPIESPIDTC